MCAPPAPRSPDATLLQTRARTPRSRTNSLSITQSEQARIRGSLAWAYLHDRARYAECYTETDSATRNLKHAQPMAQPARPQQMLGESWLCNRLLDTSRRPDRYCSIFPLEPRGSYYPVVTTLLAPPSQGHPQVCTTGDTKCKSCAARMNLECGRLAGSFFGSNIKEF